MAVKIVRVQFEVDNSELQKSDQIVSDIAKKFGVTEDRVEAVNADLQKQSGIVSQLEIKEKELLLARSKTNDPKKIQAYNKELKALEAEMGRVTTATTKASSATGSGGFGKSILGAVVGANLLTSAIQAGISGFTNFIKSGIDLAAQMEQSRISFENFTGSAEVADKVLKDLEAFGARTPFQFPELVNASKKLLAFGVSTETLLPKLQRLGDIAAGTGKPIEELALIYGKLQAKGKASLEELNQLTEAGVPIMAELAKVTGKSTAEVFKMVEQGKVGFPLVEKAINNMTSAGGKFFGLMEKQSKSFQGQLSTLRDNWDQLAKSVGERALPVLNEFVNGLNRIFQSEDSKKAEAYANNFNRIESVIKQAYNAQRAFSISIGESFDDTKLNRMKFMISLWQKERTLLVERVKWFNDRGQTEWANETIQEIKAFDDVVLKLSGTWGKTQLATDAGAESILEAGAATEEATAAVTPYTTELENLITKLGDLQKAQKQYEEGSINWKIVQKDIEDTEKSIAILEAQFSNARFRKSVEMTIEEPFRVLKEETIPDTDESIRDFYENWENINAETMERIAKEQTEGMSVLGDGETFLEVFMKVEGQIQATMSSFNQLAQAQTNEQIANIEASRDAQLRSTKLTAEQRVAIERNAQAKIAALQRQQAERDRKLAVFNVLINSAVAIVKAIAELGPIAGPIAAVLITAAAGAQLAAIESANFAKGGYTGDGQGRRDSTGEVPAGTVHAREFVFDRKITAQWKPIFEEIHAKRLSPAEMFGPMVMTGGDNTDVVRELRKIRRLSESQERRAKSMEYSSVNSQFNHKRRLING